MKHLTSFLFAASGLMILCPTEALAGPVPGRYTGGLTRSCPAAVLVNRTLNMAVATASNPTAPKATFSTRVVCNGNFGANDRLEVTLSVNAAGIVSVGGSGVIPRSRLAPLPFNFSGSGAGQFTPTSFKTTANGTVSGRPAKLIVEAKSTGKRLNVDVTIDPTDPKHPLGASYIARFSGNRP